jgi:hypothetical protein
MWILIGLLAWFVLSVPLAFVLGLIMGAHKLHAERIALPDADQTRAEGSIGIMNAPSGLQ